MTTFQLIAIYIVWVIIAIAWAIRIRRQSGVSDDDFDGMA